MLTRFRVGPRKKPTGARCCVSCLVAVLSAGASVSEAIAADVVLDRANVVALASAALSVQVADARAGEARALRVGAGALATTNPDLTVLAGRRNLASGERSTDVVASLAWPLDLSGARSARGRSVDQTVRVSEAESADTRRTMIAEALDRWVQARAAEERIAIEEARAKLDDQLVRIASVRRSAGVAGDAELALATVIAAEGRARLATARAQRSAAVAFLKGRLGLQGAADVRLAGTLGDDTPAPSLEALLAWLPQRPDVVRAARAVPAAEAAAAYEGRVGLPVPRLLAGIGRENETFARLGVDLPLPIYQRNQTNRAVAAARATTVELEHLVAMELAEAELRAAHASYLGAREAWQTLAAALQATADLERLATRGYELGSVPLATAVVSRREAALVRAAHLEALINLARARVALDRAAGTLP